jgi:hypothetical protein
MPGSHGRVMQRCDALLFCSRRMALTPLYEG